MRIDKYLWSVRLFKTRSLATTKVKEGKVELEGDTVKPSREVKVGECIRIRFGAHFVEYRILDFPKGRVGPKLVPDYAEDLTPAEERERQAMTREVMKERPKGLGRPTKRDRRNMTRFQNGSNGF